MSDIDLEVILDRSDGEVECFLDVDNEVFFGPVTEREIEVMKPLPRKTLHPCEIAQISKRGMTFHEWEDFKDQVQRNEMNDKAINEVYGLDPDTTEESFTSCCTSSGDVAKQLSCDIINVNNISVKSLCGPSIAPSLDNLSDSSINQKEDSSLLESSPDQSHVESVHESIIDRSQLEVSDVGELNDTWEIQERMLALAERLERGEDIPELGICHHSSGVVEYTARGSKSLKENKLKASPLDNQLHEARIFSENEGGNVNIKVQDLEECKNRKSDLEHYVAENSAALTQYPAMKLTMEERKTKSVEALAEEMDCLFLAESILETPTKKDAQTAEMCHRPSPSRAKLETRMKTPSGYGIKCRSTPFQHGSVKKAATTQNTVPKNALVASSPVGMYIRSLPEPILIENVRSAQKKKQIQSIPMIKPVPVAVKNKEGRWSVAKTPRSSSVSSKENCVQESDFVPVLPCVLHEAAASLINEQPMPSPRTMPGTRGKIGKLMERGPTPTVMKHNGRIQISRNTATSAKIIHSPMSARCVEPSNSLMEVSVLEAVGGKKFCTPNTTTISGRK